jgi:hypothetical protein
LASLFLKSIAQNGINSMVVDSNAGEILNLLDTFSNGSQVGTQDIHGGRWETYHCGIDFPMGT